MRCGRRRRTVHPSCAMVVPGSAAYTPSTRARCGFQRPLCSRAGCSCLGTNRRSHPERYLDPNRNPRADRRVGDASSAWRHAAAVRYRGRGSWNEARPPDQGSVAVLDRADVDTDQIIRSLEAIEHRLRRVLLRRRRTRLIQPTEYSASILSSPHWLALGSRRLGAAGLRLRGDRRTVVRRYFASNAAGRRRLPPASSYAADECDRARDRPEQQTIPAVDAGVR